MLLVKSLLNILGCVVLGMFLILYPVMYMFQEKMLFIRTGIDDYFLKIIREKFPQAEIWLTTPDNVLLHGWFHNPTGITKPPVLIYFGGNAEDISGQLFEIEHLKGWARVFINYRGYGLSQGNPTQENLFNDALTIYDNISRRDDVDSSRIVVMGRSLGTGVAVYLASQRPVRGVILVSPYDSIRNVAQRVYPFAPIELLLKHPFDSAAIAPSVKMPMLALIAAQDSTIPPIHSKHLIEKWGGKVIQKTFGNADHNTIQLADGYWAAVQLFLDSD